MNIFKTFRTPIVKYPTLVKGIIDGPIRCESEDGSEVFLPPRKGILKIEPFVMLPELNPTNYNLQPIPSSSDVFGKTFFITHLQHKARYFSLLYEPFIYHYGWFWKLQERDVTGVFRTPNSERGIYWRTFGWRWQVPDERSNWTNFIWSNGRVPGMHLD